MGLQAYDGTTALQLASKMKLAPIVAKLIAAGADPNEKTSSMALAEPKATAEGDAAAAANDGETEDGEEEGMCTLDFFRGNLETQNRLAFSFGRRRR